MGQQYHRQNDFDHRTREGQYPSGTAGDGNQSEQRQHALAFAVRSCVVRLIEP